MTPAGRTRRRAFACVCAVALATGSARAQEPAVAPTPPAEGEPSEPGGLTSAQRAATEKFFEGKQLYDDKRYVEAAEAFGRSLELAWSLETLYNLALAQDLAEQWVAALRSYRTYLELAPTEDEGRPTALKRSELARQRVAEVLLQLDSPQAIREIRINGVPVAQDAFPWLTRPGPLEVEFFGEAPGQVKKIRADARAGGTATIVFPGFLNPLVGPVKAPEPARTDPLQQKRQRRVQALRAGFWTTTSLTLAGGVTVAVLGPQVLQLKRIRDSDCESQVCTDGQIQDRLDAENKFPDFKLATNVAIAVTATLGVAALALGIVLRRERSAGQASTRAGVRWLGSAVELTF